MLSVLLLGYGKIGVYKATIWRRLGITVYVVDPDRSKVLRAREEGFRAFERIEELGDSVLRTISIVDVSVPSGYHAVTLATVVPLLRGCRTVLIEKPVVSSLRELKVLQELLARYKGQIQLYVNESYYVSEGLRCFKQYLDDRTQPYDITITFAKNRLPDIRNGRFVDTELGPYGIELPHMLACLNYLGFGDNQVVTNTWHQNVYGEINSEAVICLMEAGAVQIRLVEILGPFYLDSSSRFVPDWQAPVRRDILARFEDGTQAILEFDPVKGLRRYTSLLTTPDNVGAIDDDHIARILSLLTKCTAGDRRAAASLQTVSIQKALEELDMIFALHREAEIIDYLAVSADKSRALQLARR